MSAPEYIRYHLILTVSFQVDSSTLLKIVLYDLYPGVAFGSRSELLSISQQRSVQIGQSQRGSVYTRANMLLHGVMILWTITNLAPNSSVAAVDWSSRYREVAVVVIKRSCAGQQW